MLNVTKVALGKTTVVVSYLWRWCKAVKQRTVEQIGDVPVPQIQEQIQEVVIVIPQERFSILAQACGCVSSCSEWCRACLEPVLMVSS